MEIQNKTIKEQHEEITNRIAKRIHTIKEAKESLAGRDNHIQTTNMQRENARLKYEQKMANLDAIIATAEKAKIRDAELILERESNLEKLLEVQTEFETKYEEYLNAIEEETEIKADMSKGLEEFKYIANKFVNIKKQLKAIADKAGKAYRAK